MATNTLYRPITIGSLELPGNLFLAPVAGYTDRAFRSICSEAGADFSFTELVSAEAITRNPGYYGLGGTAAAKKAPGAFLLALPQISRVCDTESGNGSPGGKPRAAVQLFGAESKTLGRACALLGPLRPDAVDLNAGCPVPKVVKTGAGSALMRDPARLGRAVEAMVSASNEFLGGIPVTVKIRAGWDAVSQNYAECARIAVEAGAAMVSLHPRTRAQGYGGKSDWSLIADLAARLTVPVTGSGDLYTPEDARSMLAETGCAAVMFARGAMGNPFIFGAAKSFLTQGSWTAPEPAERLRTALYHLEKLAEDLGETSACLEMRKQFCAYTKGTMGLPGISGGAALRDKLVHAGTIAEYREILSYYR
ncbi:tRNA-dihydrouridine synthase [Spirochaetia bacterium]|nr:tRNA-dihydrouridine synthase [Spirochaetia bacterium]